MQSERVQAGWFYDTIGWFDTHRKQTGQAAIALAVLALIISYYFYSHGQKEDAAAAGFSRLMLTRAPVAEFLKFQTENRGTQAGPKALLLAAQELFASGNYPEALTQFQKFRQEYRNNPLATTASFGAAASLDAQGKIDEAITAYSELSQRGVGDMITIQSEFALGRLYETKGQFDKAVDHYAVVVQGAGNSDFANEAFVHAAELRAAHPEIVKSAPAAATPAITVK